MRRRKNGANPTRDAKINGLRFSTVTRRTDNQPETHEASIAEFVEALRSGKHIDMPRDKFTALPDGTRKRLKDGPAVVLAVFDRDLAPLSKKGGWRDEPHIAEVSGATFDLDDGNPSIDDVAACLEGLEAVIHESASSRPDQRKLRVFVPYAVPVSVAQHYAAWDALKKRLDPKWIDRSLGRDPGRLCYAPPSFAGGECGEIRVQAGARYDPTAAPRHEAPAKLNGKQAFLDRFRPGVDLQGEMTAVATGESYHDALLRITASMAAKGNRSEQIEAACRAVLSGSKPNDTETLERWQREWDDLDRTIGTALEKYAPRATEPHAADHAEKITALLRERGRRLDRSVLSARPAGPRFVWGDYMSRGTVTIVSAIGGLGKSQVGIAHGVRAACGWEFLNASTLGGERVWYVSLEDSPDAVHLRIHKAAQALVTEDRSRSKFATPVGEDELYARIIDRFRYVDLYGAQFRVAMKVQGELMPTPDLDLLAEYIEAEGGADVVYVDTLIRSHSADENSNDEMARVLVGYEGFARRLDAAVPLLVHVPKSKGDDRTSHAARGAGAITDNARSAINITAATMDDVKGFANADPAWVNPENPKLLRITHGKSNYAGKTAPRWALLREGWVEEFHPVESAAAIEERLYKALQAWWVSPTGYKSRPLAKSAIEARLESIKEHSGQPKVGKRQWQAALAWAIDEGHAVPAVEEVGDNPDSRFYRLNPVAGVPSPSEDAE
jgi:hypothetical protein